MAGASIGNRGLSIRGMKSTAGLLNFAGQMGAWATWDRRRRTFAIVAAAVLVAAIAYALVVRNVSLGARGTTAFDDIGEALAAAIAAGACGWAATRASGRERLAWSLMGISAGMWGAGEVVWSIYEVGMNVATPYPSLADLGFLAAVPFAIAGIRAFWSAPRGTSARWRVWFDGVIVAVALTSTAWAFGLRTVWQSSSATRVLDLAYPVSDILIGTILILAIRRANQQQAGRMAFLLAGVASYSIADSAFAYLNAQGAFGAVGNAIDTGWFAGFLMIALAATYPAGSPKAATEQAPLDLWQLALPWMTLLLASAGDVYASLSGHDIDLFMSSLTATLAILLTVNMILERKEFLEMLTDIETARATLNREFKTALVGIQHMSDQVSEADRAYDEGVRVLAADIHGQAERLDHILEGML
jgi:diguanylate cyclase